MFWDIFYNLCTERETSPNAVCKTLGLSNSMATYWKNGTMPKSDVLVQIADYFDVSTDYLLGRTNSLKSTESGIKIGNITGDNNLGNTGNVMIGTTVPKQDQETDSMIEEFMQRFAQLSLDDKVDVMHFTLQKDKRGV